MMEVNTTESNYLVLEPLFLQLQLEFNIDFVELLRGLEMVCKYTQRI